MLTPLRSCCHVILLGLVSLGASAQPGDPANLWTQATLYRDEWGVPHVFADTPQALGFAFGYAQSEDHLLDMLLAYHMANGRLAMVLGEPYASTDAFALKMNHARLAREAFPILDPATQALCVGFAQGVNLYILEHGPSLPEWVEGVQPQDILALWHAFILSGAPYDLPLPYTRPRAAQTGNAWALAPARTAENKSILVINPHQYFDGPFRWYEAHLRLGATDITGATLFGLPVILQGHNHVLGWAMTPNQPDTADLFEEDLDGPRRNPKIISGPSSNADQTRAMLYLSQSQSYLVNTPGGMQERSVPAYMNSRGPVFENGSEFHSWRIGGFLDFGGLGQLMAMAAAQSLEQFQQALAMQQLPSFNIIYADAKGNIFYLYNAKTGVRNLLPGSEEVAKRGIIDWKSPLPREFDSAAWGAIIPLNQLPAIVNPKDGFLQACNSAPWFATGAGALAPGAWPPWFITEGDTYRARRARQLLEHGTRSFREVQAMLYDIVLPAAADLAPRLVGFAETLATQAEAAHPDLPAALLMLKNWNYAADAGSTAMTYYGAWWESMRLRAGKQYTTDGPFYDWILRGEPQAQEMMFGAAADAVRLMRNRYQAISVPWGDVHRIRRGERDEAMLGAGSGDPLFVADSTTPQNGKGYVDYGYGFAMTIQFGDEPEAWSVVPFGASEMPDSQHYSDQLDLLLERRLKKTRFLEEDVLRHAVSARGRVVRLLPLGVDGGVTFQSPVTIHARLNASVDAPGTLPEGLVPFTLFVQPEYVPAGASVGMSFSFTISDEICAPSALPELSVYAFSEAEGWQPVVGQALDPAKRRLSGDIPNPAVLAVLGPADLLKPVQPSAPETPPLQVAGPVVPGAPESPKQADQPPAMPAPQAAPEMPVPTADTIAGNKGNFGAAPSPQTTNEDFARQGGRARRKFKVERLDAPQKPAQEQPAVNPDGTPQPAMGFTPSGKRKFFMQILDKVTPGKSKEEKQEAPPQEDVPTGERTFKMEPVPAEGQPAPAEPAAPPVETETDTAPPPAEANPAPDEPVPNVSYEITLTPPVETVAPESEPAPAPSDSDTATAPASEATQEMQPAPPAPEVGSPAENVVPAQGTGKRVFKMEPVKP